MTKTTHSDISRRQLLKGMAAAGAVAGTWSLVGCSSRNEGSNAAGSSSETKKSKETSSTPKPESNATSAETSAPAQIDGWVSNNA